ncbi:hypothetical protein D9M72_412960 [compost metagenome]
MHAAAQVEAALVVGEHVEAVAGVARPAQHDVGDLEVRHGHVARKHEAEVAEGGAVAEREVAHLVALRERSAQVARVERGPRDAVGGALQLPALRVTRRHVAGARERAGVDDHRRAVVQQPDDLGIARLDAPLGVDPAVDGARDVFVGRHVVFAAMAARRRQAGLYRRTGEDDAVERDLRELEMRRGRVVRERQPVAAV